MPECSLTKPDDAGGFHGHKLMHLAIVFFFFTAQTNGHALALLKKVSII